MTTPRRWRDDPTASASVRDLLQAGLSSKRLPGDVRQRSAARVNRLILVPAAAGVLVWIKGAAMAGLCVVGTMAVVHQMTGAKTPSDHPVAKAPTPKDVAQSVPLAAPASPALLARGATGHELQARVAAARTATPAMSAIPATPAPPALLEPPIAWRPLDSLAREASMLEESRAMLDTNPGGALAKLDRYAELFPDGRLTMESGLLAVDALKRLGRRAEARVRGAALLDHSHGSLYEARIRALMRE
jgi:hypothetical protein